MEENYLGTSLLSRGLSETGSSSLGLAVVRAGLTAQVFLLSSSGSAKSEEQVLIVSPRSRWWRPGLASQPNSLVPSPALLSCVLFSFYVTLCSVHTDGFRLCGWLLPFSSLSGKIM